MIKASIGNFLIIGIMAVLFILLLKSMMGAFPIKGLKEVAFAV